MAKTTIAKRLVIICIALIAVISLISTTLGYVLYKHRISHEYKKLADEYSHHLIQAIALPLWMMEYDAVRHMCRLFYETTPWTVSLTIFDSDGNTLCSETGKLFSVSIVKTQDVTYEGINVGKVKVEFTYELANREVFNVFIFHLIIIALVALVLSVGVSWFTWKTITIPLSHFAECMKKIASGDYDLSLPDESRYQELSIILKEMMNMSEEIRKREELLRAINEKLQLEIEKREEALQAFKESEAKFKAVMSVAGDCVIISYSNGRIDYANRASELLFGYSGEEFLKLTICDLFSEPDKKLLEKYVLKREKLTLSLHEMTAIKRDGSTVPVEVSLANTFEEGNSAELVVAIVRDLSWRKEMEREKIETTERMHRLQKFEAIGTLASGIAHDFNNILTVIIGYTDLARFASPEDAPVQEYLSHVCSACSRAKDLIQQIFAIGRSQPSEAVVFNPAPLIKEAVKFLRASVPSTIGIEYKLRDTEIYIKADPSQFQQVLMNLCTNSVHAMESKGEGLLTIETQQVTFDSPKNCLFSTLPAGDYLKLAVIDTGHGIPPTIISKIFDPYFTTKEPTKGTGLGLSIVRNVVLSCGGDMEIISEIGKGTTMLIYLPVVRREKFPLEMDEDKIDAKPGEGKSLLFVDDESSIVELVSLTLTTAGYKVYAFTDPKEAWEFFKNHAEDIHLVITDITMPRIRGDILAKMISSTEPSMPIIICTGYGFSFSQEVLMELGVKEVLYKPFSSKQLIETIERVLSKTK
ncbi:MAG: ATP-binding protein [Syntrophobacterales bacterium]|nr:ATP-binding protein [Syntrophobacterales bacterium]